MRNSLSKPTKRFPEINLHISKSELSKSHKLTKTDKQIVDDAIYFAKKAGKGNVKGAMEQLETDTKGFLSYGKNGNYEPVRDYMREQLWDKPTTPIRRSRTKK